MPTTDRFTKLRAQFFQGRKSLSDRDESVKEWKHDIGDTVRKDGVQATAPTKAVGAGR